MATTLQLALAWDWAKITAIGIFAVLLAVILSDLPIFVALALPAAALLACLPLRYPLIALSLLIVMIVTNLSQNLISQFGLPSIAKLAAPGLLLLLAARLVIYGERPFFGPIAASFLAGFLALKLLGTSYAYYWAISLPVVVEYIKDAILAMLALAFMQYRYGFTTVSTTTVLTGATLCGLGAYQIFFGETLQEFYGFARTTDNSGRFSGPIDDANFFAAIIVFCVPLALCRVLNARSTASVMFWSIATGLLIFGLLITQSRGGIIALLIALPVLLLGMNGRQIALTGALVLAVGAVVLSLISDELIERLATIHDVLSSTETLDHSTEGRLASWQVAFELFKEHPWLGVGPGNFNVHYQDLALELGLIFRGEGRSAHSLYLEVLTEQGLVGLGFFLVMLVAAGLGVASAARRARNAGQERLARQFIAFGAGLAGYLTAMAFLQDSFPRFLWIMVILGIEAGRIARSYCPTGGDTGSPPGRNFAGQTVAAPPA